MTSPYKDSIDFLWEKLEAQEFLEEAIPVANRIRYTKEDARRTEPQDFPFLVITPTGSVIGKQTSSVWRMETLYHLDLGVRELDIYLRLKWELLSALQSIHFGEMPQNTISVNIIELSEGVEEVSGHLVWRLGVSLNIEMNFDRA